MIRSTTIVAVKKGDQTAIAGDGQVTMGESTVLKAKARKVRRLAGGKVICGFAGAVADCQALLERLEAKIDASGGHLRRGAVEFAKEWRTDRMLRQLNAMIVAADAECLLLVSGDGNVIEPDDGLAAVGSGGPFALSAARALIKHTQMGAEEIARESLSIAADVCVFTNHEIVVETL